ncbi:MAG: helix-turn-helix domain-containing protein [Thermogutta sp.]
MNARSEFVSPTELAKRLNVSRRTVFRLVSAGRLPQPIRLSKRTVRWQWADVEEFLAKHERPKRAGGRRG